LPTYITHWNHKWMLQTYVALCGCSGERKKGGSTSNGRRLAAEEEPGRRPRAPAPTRPKAAMMVRLPRPGGARWVLLRRTLPASCDGSSTLRAACRAHSSSSGGGGGPLPAFAARVARREMRGGDARQTAALAPLQRLFEELVAEAATGGGGAGAASEAAGGGGGGGWFFSAAPAVAEPTRRAASCQGVYTHGGVGCGKTMLMELFAACVEEAVPSLNVKQVHFAAFMLDVHKRLHALKQQGGGADPLITVAEEILAEGPSCGSVAGVLCFDEFQVTDIADAMVIRRIFSHLFGGGMVVVATSNRPPSDLYLHGLQRESFLPFIDDVYEHCEVHNVDAGAKEIIAAPPSAIIAA
jgi:hypothetical protein